MIPFFDWALFKGILISHLQFQDVEIVIVNTHLNGNHSGDWRRTNPLAVTQYKQVQQLARWIDRLPPDALVVLWKTSLDYLLLHIPQGRMYDIQADIIVVEDLTQRNPLKRFLTDHCALTLKISI